MKEELDFILSYRAKFEVSSIRLELEEGYDCSPYLYHRFDLMISCGDKVSNLEVWQSASLINMEPPAEEIYPDSDPEIWRYEDKDDYNSSATFNDLTDTQKEVVKRAIELVCNAKQELKAAYKLFWTTYIQREKELASAKLSRAERMQNKLDSFLKTIE